MDSVTPIETKEIIKKSDIVSFSAEITNLELFKSVTIFVTYLDNDGNVNDTKTIKLEGQDYLNWSNDDQYIINKVAEICGFVLKTT
jgi:hypothetical protein